METSLSLCNLSKYKLVTFTSSNVSYICFQQHNGVIDPRWH